MIIDCHGHYTTAPAPLGEYRDAQTAALEGDPGHVGEKGIVAISDDAIRESVEGAQLKLQRERGTDVTIFSPRASWMGRLGRWSNLGAARSCSGLSGLWTLLVLVPSAGESGGRACPGLAFRGLGKHRRGQSERECQDGCAGSRE
jgi:hypothetical protein